ncbi:hypothetical protein GTP58_21245 [Duganella sp. CY15W]|uniref:hypothetical protein n=1 Tax=Duganella sp. CY15W TaxID=2692172 RepID=UPI00136BD874|nr:hypothetical protein [Duganella sp. CY15W]MYM30865.1 hypothetical protein [Duganella sp. CY15W]
MKKNILRQLFVLPLLVAVMAALHACGSATGSVRAPAPFTTTYVLHQGGSVALTSAATGGAGVASSAPALKLDRVNDSRCRKDAVCVWAGYISFSFALVQPDGSTSNFVLSDNMPNGTTTINQGGLNFTLVEFDPKEVPAKNETTPDYRVSLKVSNTNSP